jgi:transposase
MSATDATREARAKEIAVRSRLTCKDGVWNVPSQQTMHPSYQVRLDPDSCTCDDFTLRQKPCKHILAVRILVQQDTAPEPEFTKEDIAALKRPTYPQQWPEYNAAQTNERRHFMALLADLCQGIPEPERKPGKGRPPIPLRDLIYSACFKVYSLKSARRFNGELEEAHAQGYISRVPHFNSVLNCLENPDVTPILVSLVERSALPLRAVETEFAFDSSGFSVCKFIKWYDEKYTERSGRDWVKVHIACGVKTNVVTAVRILDRDAGDSTQFRPLLATTAENFQVEAASADKAYSGRENIEAVTALGGFPAIAFKSNATGEVGGDFGKLFFYYCMNREDFLKTYHQRSNVESTFSMVKRKFGDSVRAKTDTAMKNEALAKFVCHNICCVIASWYELGINPDFLSAWGCTENEAVAQILPFKRY